MGLDTKTLKTSRWILLPGTLCNASVFNPLLDALQVPQEQRIELLLTKPAVEDYQSYFEHDINSGDVICGFSLGAIVAAHHAHIINNASALILFGINPHQDNPCKTDGRIALQNDVHSQGARAALQSRMPALNGPTPDKALAQILIMAEQTAEHIDAHTALALTRPGAFDSLRACKAPVYALTGDRDQQAPSEYASAAANTAPHGHCKLLEGLGHYAMIEDPATCAAAVESMML